MKFDENLAPENYLTGEKLEKSKLKSEIIDVTLLVDLIDVVIALLYA